MGLSCQKAASEGTMCVEKIQPFRRAHYLVCNHRQATDQGRFCAVTRKHGQRFAYLFGQVGHIYSVKWWVQAS